MTGADYYRVGDKKKHHYGWQIFLDGRRIVNPHKILLPDNDPLQYFRVIEVSAVINPDLDVNKSVSVGEDGGKIEIVIDQGEYDEDSLHLLERGTRG